MKSNKKNEGRMERLPPEGKILASEKYFTPKEMNSMNLSRKGV